MRLHFTTYDGSRMARSSLCYGQPECYMKIILVQSHLSLVSRRGLGGGSSLRGHYANSSRLDRCEEPVSLAWVKLVANLFTPAIDSLHAYLPCVRENYPQGMLQMCPTVSG